MHASNAYGVSEGVHAGLVERLVAWAVTLDMDSAGQTGDCGGPGL